MGKAGLAESPAPGFKDARTVGGGSSIRPVLKAIHISA
jgi:hypothetical protein